jgi:Domain of unknown function (DUF4150)/GHH signature containing HNH/Endo VII superfamily nuclease toxin  2
MANEVYANGMEIACKAASGKSIAAFPDTCLSPPSPPAGPIPIPYPNSAYASDATNGSTTVMISGQEVMLKDQSTFKKSTGDEAATKSLGMGVVTHAIQGEASFVAWSMDVKIEGQNVDRHLDQMMHNEQCNPANTAPWIYLDAASLTAIKDCDEEAAAKKSACEDKGLNTRSEQCGNSACNKAKKCLLVTKQQGDRDSESTKVGCCDGEQPHHLIEGHGLLESGGTTATKFPDYKYEAAPCVCADGDRWTSEHGDMHQSVGKKETAAVRKAATKRRSPDYAWNYGEAKNAGINAHQKVFRAGCSRKCLEAQLDAYHNDVGCYDHILLRTYDVEAAGHI